MATFPNTRFSWSSRGFRLNPKLKKKLEPFFCDQNCIEMATEHSDFAQRSHIYAPVRVALIINSTSNERKGCYFSEHDSSIIDSYDAVSDADYIFGIRISIRGEVVVTKCHETNTIEPMSFIQISPTTILYTCLSGLVYIIPTSEDQIHSTVAFDSGYILCDFDSTWKRMFLLYNPDKSILYVLYLGSSDDDTIAQQVTIQKICFIKHIAYENGCLFDPCFIRTGVNIERIMILPESDRFVVTSLIDYDPDRNEIPQRCFAAYQMSSSFISGERSIFNRYELKRHLSKFKLNLFRYDSDYLRGIENITERVEQPFIVSIDDLYDSDSFYEEDVVSIPDPPRLVRTGSIEFFEDATAENPFEAMRSDLRRSPERLHERLYEDRYASSDDESYEAGAEESEAGAEESSNAMDMEESEAGTEESEAGAEESEEEYYVPEYDP